MRRTVLALAVVCAVVVVGAASSAPKSVFLPTPLSVGSAPSPFTPGCEGVPQSGTLYENADVEPRVAVDPTDPTHIVGVFQEDRKRRHPPNRPVLQRHGRGTAWSEPITLQRENRISGSLFVDKESITADPFDSNFVYAVWDRSTFPSDSVSLSGLAHTRALRSQTVFARTTNGGVSWQQARPIFDEEQAISFTIGNQIVVAPSAGPVPTLVNAMFLFHGSGVQRLCCDVAVLRSTDRGVTWSGPITVSKVDAVGVVDPDTGQGVRTEDIIPDIAAGLTTGRVYAVCGRTAASAGRREGRSTPASRSRSRSTAA
jgi:hypothetical protein